MSSKKCGTVRYKSLVLPYSRSTLHDVSAEHRKGTQFIEHTLALPNRRTKPGTYPVNTSTMFRASLSTVVVRFVTFAENTVYHVRKFMYDKMSGIELFKNGT